MIPAVTLWAAGGELVPILIMIVIAIVSAAVQWLNKAMQPPKPQQGGARAPRPAAPQARPVKADPLEDEIGEFLRRAAQRRGGAPAQPAPRVEAVQAEMIREAPVGGGVTAHVQEYLNSGEFTRRSAELGGEVAQADAQAGERLHEVFDHEMSSLTSRPGESAVAAVVEGSPLPEDRAAPATPASLLALFGDAENVRQAIVANEILHRPVERWT